MLQEYNLDTRHIKREIYCNLRIVYILPFSLYVFRLIDMHINMYINALFSIYLVGLGSSLGIFKHQFAEILYDALSMVDGSSGARGLNIPRYALKTPTINQLVVIVGWFTDWLVGWLAD